MCMRVFLVLAWSWSLIRCQENYTSFGSGLEEEGSGFELVTAYTNTSSCGPPEATTAANCSSKLWKHWKNNSCECGDELHGIVLCSNKHDYVDILQCYCIHSDNGTHNSTDLAVGSCLYGCYNTDYYNIYTNYTTGGDLNSPCVDFNRTGWFCSKCMNGTGMPVYSFSFKCVECEYSWHNVAKYIAIAYGPLTIFLIIIVVFTVSVNSAPLHGYIFVAQMLSSSMVTRIMQAMTDTHGLHINQTYCILFGATVYGFWNLDFFRFVNHNFCLNPNVSTLTVMALDYLIAVYPIVIIVLTYVVVELHDRGYRVLVFLWKPFHYCFARFRHDLNVRTSLVDAFGTFFSLSYVKFLSTTVDLMASTPVWDMNNNRKHRRIYYDATITFFSLEHAPYAVIGLVCFTLFNVLPILFLLLYPRRCFQKRMPAYMRRILHPFMDTLLGPYKDGTDGTWDCRFFVVVYLIARIAFFCTIFMSLNTFVFILLAIVATVTGMLVAVVQPYKSAVYNTIDTVLILLLALTFAGISSFFFALRVSTKQLPFSRSLAIIPIPFPFLYACGLTVYNTCVLGKLPRRIVRILRSIVLCSGRAYFFFADKFKRKHEMESFSTDTERTRLVRRRRVITNRDLND